MKRIKEKIRNMHKWLQTRRKLRRMDEIWRFYGGGCFGLYPPSFYHKHSKEEIERLEREKIAKLKEIIKDFEGAH